MPSNNEICRMEAVELTARVRAKELSPVEVVDAVLERMDRLEPTLHAFCAAWSRRSPRAKTPARSRVYP
jgi:aspartyl-tRNA(Asn)/glutamyl-tRNA(Gln) amidotransferase subunit A